MSEDTKKKISSIDTIEDIFNRFPQKAQKIAHELSRCGLQCVGCSAATWETVESGMMKHGKNQEELIKLVEKLNQIIEETSSVGTISLTKRAAKKFKEIAEAEGMPNAKLLFGEELEGCSGFKYVLDFTEEKQEDEVSFESEGVEICIHQGSLDNLLGSEIDYVDGLQSGFKISNPNVAASCGCGSSHGYKEEKKSGCCSM